MKTIIKETYIFSNGLGLELIPSFKNLVWYFEFRVESKINKISKVKG